MTPPGAAAPARCQPIDIIMISKILSRLRAPASQPNAEIPAGQRIYAIGDIHGRYDLLKSLLDQIAADEAARGGSPATLIFLGDLVDRGPESAQVVERLLQLSRERPEGTTRFLLGNHEEVFLGVLGGDIKALKFFNRIGGRETILSYGISETEYDGSDYPALMELVLDRVPAQHGEFLRSFEDMIIVGDYVYVHAGIRPSEPLEKQRASDLRWIRDEFLSSTAPHPKIVVHGHTISDDVEITNNRIGIDTGAYRSGTLTAMGFEGESRWQIQTELVADIAGLADAASRHKRA
jgi:serine/threonine protein phosphatase 1